MASMVSRLPFRFTTARTALALLIAAPLVGIPATCVANELSPEQRAWYQARLGLGGNAAGSANQHAIGEAVVEWQQLTQNPRPSFDRIAAFLMQHRNWPNELELRRAAEAALDAGGYVPPQAAAYFDRVAPVSAGGHLRHALALSAANRGGDAVLAARRAWTGGALTEAEEMRLLSTFGGSLTAADHDARMERLLWDNLGQAATRQLPFTSAGRRLEFAARAAFRTRATVAALRAAEAEAADPSLLTRNAGYIADKATWLRASGQTGAARRLLAAERNLSAPPLDAEEWLETLLTNARAAVAEGDSRTGYAIAQQVGDALPPGADILAQPIGVRDDYTSLVWLAADTALRRLSRPEQAAQMFERYAAAGRSPQVQARGLYWAGRSYEQAGNRGAATQRLETAARHFDQFYGQLALERLGRAQPRPAPGQRTALPEAETRAFADSSVVRAARVLGELGSWREQTLFLRSITQMARSEAEHAMAFSLARDIGRPDLAVMMGRSARANGLDSYIPDAFPTVRVPAGSETNWTFIHAITRQESQFDRAAVSHAGARGMMQLMPGTAREQAGRLGLPYDLSRLTSDTEYNIMMGSDYFRRMVDYFGGSYPLAVAAYNAGPGNVNRWLRANGDPRTGAVDILQWIEAIPLSETRNYVQRVLENAVVYETINPSRQGQEQRNLLSRYLGKSSPG